MLKQTFEEAHSRWTKSHKILRNVESSLDQLWIKCKEIVEPILGGIEVAPTNNVEEEIEKLCSKLVEEATKWKTKCNKDSHQETKLILADSFKEFRMTDLELQEVEPQVSTHATILDNWYNYCGKIHEQEQETRLKVHQFMIQL